MDAYNDHNIFYRISAQAVQKKRNFQLIVITHDQDFVERVMAENPSEYYYKVSRDKK